MSLSRTYRTAVIVGVGIVSVCASVGSAGAANTYIPPRVAPPTVDIGPTIIGGQVIDPGLHVTLPTPAAEDNLAPTPPASEPRNDACQDPGIQFAGPSIGQVATVIGPTIIGGVTDTPIQVGPGQHAVNPSPTTTAPMTTTAVTCADGFRP